MCYDDDMRFNYWSCSRFADLVRGVKKPCALTFDEWEEWRESARSSHPFRYWLAEEFLDALQNFACFPADLVGRVRSYCRNRFFFKTHYLKTGLRPGVYHELDERILHGLFNELKWFVEVELASLHRWMPGEKKYRFRRGRCKEAGLDHLDWAASLTYGRDMGVGRNDPLYGTPTPQAECAKTTKELYDWWESRANRELPYLCEDPQKGLKLEEKYDREDDRMLLKLIKIRRQLWT